MLFDVASHLSLSPRVAEDRGSNMAGWLQVTRIHGPALSRLAVGKLVAAVWKISEADII